jgi:uncharacterized protein (DUF488 family)
MKTDPNTKLQVFTIGHSNRSLEEFLSLLQELAIEVVADVRRYPSSRKFPHFNSNTLQSLLEKEGTKYIWLEALGGRRHGIKNNKSPNTALKSLGFRNYADYMNTKEFQDAAKNLIATAAKTRTAILCAERFYWKCHRRLLSDYLTAQGVEVIHIIELGQVVPHKLTPSAVVTDKGFCLYPQPERNNSQMSFLDLSAEQNYTKDAF